ncbi:antibiotic biosynthesis monooxygenase [Rhizobium sp. KVB221]|uniref:Antibiotic biosynthesis monooxygenase n=1 Tax=Rhizobium setariae TaxID=2801340 RepID=A0A937CNM5_9HYPH|nr:antibiotic biosynthesis monooxygenase [Rhizobium setariae]MBL0371363.1 antibiotic biosynthesis monooxygenase [Rhizobium setariae]
MSQPAFASTPRPPYYVVTFSSQRTDGDNGYSDMAEKMAELAAKQPGYLGVESARGSDGFGITNSFWADEQSIRSWKAVLDHLDAQNKGREKWYERYEVRVGKVERAYSFGR